MNISVDPGPVTFGSGLPLVFIGGPCVIESEDHALKLAVEIKKITEKAGVSFVFKSSYDKANRSSPGSFRGIGADEGLRTLEKVRAETGSPVITDIHSPAEAASAGEVVDIIQIPAFLCRQTDLLYAAGKTGKPVNVKKGPFMAPWDMVNVIEKIKQAGNDKVMLTERGASFGYNNLVVDMSSIYEMSKTGAPIVFDAGHSAQRPGGLGKSSGGDRNLIPPLARAAVAVGISALFLETHNDPDNAPCDGPNMWPVQKLSRLLDSLKRIDSTIKES
ncbi:MAG TPA: 3-deoxy-8-phosphooctulonate synthase [Nitrospirae bacterium]|nr:3-deoxy-8-phosphooctulonate synthase [Nitrospirota bacterium]